MSRVQRQAAAFIGVALLASSPAGAIASHGRSAPAAPVSDRGDHQHGGMAGHLPPVRRNVQLVAKLSPVGRFGDVVPGQIADLELFDGWAYLNSFREETCQRGGVYVIDARNPRKPKEAGFIPALAGNFHGEGAQVISADTRSFEGDVLAVNNELCDPDAMRGGGIDLYDVTDPAQPKVLVQGFGDFGDEGSLEGDPNGRAHEVHSVFLWRDGRRLYAVAVDDDEAHDVDIFDVSDPRHPKPVAEFALPESFAQILDQSANGDEVFFHDVVVKKIDGRQTMLASYWDAGYVTLDVDDPATPRYLGDTSFDGPDPLTGVSPPEGNAHEAEFSADDRFILAADEDFSPYRSDRFAITTGPNAGDFPSQTVSGGASAAALPDHVLNGPVVYGGYGCDASAPVPERSGVALPPLGAGEEAILVLQRGPVGDPSAPEGACFPGEKAANAHKAGWDAVLLVNRHLGSASDDAPYCGAGGFPPGVQIVTVCTTHEAFHRLFGSEPRFEQPYQPGDAPAPGTIGQKIQATARFDGWGYAHLYRNENGKIREIGAFAIPEALDPAFAFGFGDLSIHELATDPHQRMAYSSYYAGGLRVFSFDDNGLKEVGAFIDKGGNNFWGIEVARDHGRTLIAASDRDYGLYLFQYTGPR